MDGVFAIAMTLLVLDLRLPAAHAEDNGALWHQLTGLAPQFAAYALSFTMLATFWLALHALLRLCGSSDRHLMWACCAFLFFVTTLPFTASVLADHTRLALAVGLYWLNLAMLGAGLAWVLTHVVRAGLADDDNRHGLVLVRRRLVLAQTLYAIAALVALLSPQAATGALTVLRALAAAAMAGVSRSVAGLTPGYFAFVMATGIVALALRLDGFALPALVLLALAAAGYAVLVALNVWRLTAYREDVLDDFRDPRRAFGFFAFVAGTNVLGVGAGSEGWFTVTAVLLAVRGRGVVAARLRRAVDRGAGQGRTPVARRRERDVVRLGRGQPVGGGRCGDAGTGRRGRAAGARRARRGVVVARLLPLRRVRGVRGAAAPALPSRPARARPVVLGRHGRARDHRGGGLADRRDDRRARGDRDPRARRRSRGDVLVVRDVADPGAGRRRLVAAPGEARAAALRAGLWSAIFPLGMYAVASISLGRADRLPLVESIGLGWVWVVLVAWAAVFAAMVTHLWRAVSPSASSAP